MRVVPGLEGETRLSAFCEREGDAWRVHVHPGGAPEYLESCFDAHGEAFPVFLDFEDLTGRVNGVSGSFRTRETRLGSVELDAAGNAADSAAQWLLGSIASGVRPSNAP